MERVECKCGWEGQFEELRIIYVARRHGRGSQGVACPRCGSSQNLDVIYQVALN